MIKSSEAYMTKENFYTTERAIKLIKGEFMSRYGISEETLGQLDPYRWADHIDRFDLWVIQGYIELIKPEDEKTRRNLLIYSVPFVNQACSAFRNLDDNNDDLFKQDMQKLGFKINQMPSRTGPWNRYDTQKPTSPAGKIIKGE
jgi:hypothetical protein